MMYSVSQFNHDYQIRVVAQIVAQYLREETRVTSERMFEVLQYRVAALTPELISDALGMLRRARIAWQDTSGHWYAASLRVLFLDDDEARHRRFAREAEGHQVIPVRTAAEAISVLNTAGPNLDMIYLDHDLGGETMVDSSRKDCGMEVARWLADRFAVYGEIPVICHSLNHSERENMCHLLQGAGYLAAPGAFAWQWPPITSLLQLVEGEPKECAEDMNKQTSHDSTGSPAERHQVFEPPGSEAESGGDA
jgi:CheY-like chemotaxis protein